MSDEEFDEIWDLRGLDLYGSDEESDMSRMDELIEKAKKDPFWQKPKKKEKPKKAKKFSGYNWTTHKKKLEGIIKKTKELKEKKTLTEQEQTTMKRMTNLLRWHQWALKKHKEGWSDKRIHEETQRRRKAKK